MDWLITGILAAAIAWAINTWISSWGGSFGISILVPLVEEVTKTGLTLLIGSGLVMSHAVFGAIEAVYEIRRDHQIGSALAAFIMHLFFGIATLGLFRYSGNWVLAILGTVLLHSIWNLLIIRFFTRPVGGKIS